MWLLTYLAHLYLYWSFRRVVADRRWRSALIGFLSAITALLLLRNRLFASSWGAYFSEFLFLWVGCLAFVSSCLIVRDVFRLIAERVAGRTGGIAATLRSRRCFFAALCAGIAMSAYAVYEATDVRVTTLTIATNRLPPDVRRLRIAAIADFHLHRFSRLSRLESLVGLVNAQQPDVIVMLGDFVDTAMSGRGGELAALRALDAHAGKYSVIGNHEVYRGINQSVAFMDAAGFRTLRGEAVEVGGIVVAGVDDPLVATRKGVPDVLRDTDAARFVLLLSHRPETPPEARGMFDLQLSGHTHGGQIWPLRMLMRLARGDAVGGYSAPPAAEGGGAGRGAVYVTTGVGYKRPPMRLFVPPEIVVVDLVREPDGSGKSTPWRQ